jgi:hypothetical protein
LHYGPALIRARVRHPREWDGLAIDADSCWLFDAFASPNWRDLKIGRGRT